MKHKGPFLAMLILILFRGLTLSASSELLTVIVSNNPPLAYFNESGEAAGFNIRILEYIADLEGWETRYVYRESFSESLAILEETPEAIHAAVAFSDIRSKQYVFGEETVFHNWARIYERRGESIESLEDLKGKRVALVSNTIHAAALINLCNQLGIKFRPVYVENQPDHAVAVEKGLADAFVTSRTAGFDIQKKYDIEETPIIFNPVEVRYAGKLGTSEARIARIDEHLARLKGNHSSFYYTTLEEVFGGSHVQIPRWIRTAAVLAVAAALVMAFLAVIFRREVHRVTGTLKENLETFQFMVEHSKAMHWEYDLLNDRFTYVSPQAEELLGFPPSEWTTFESWSRMVHIEDREWASAYCKTESQAGRDHTFSYRAVTKSGQVKWITDLSRVVTENGTPKRLVGILIDGTQEQKKEDASDLNRRLLSSVQEAGHLGIWRYRSNDTVELSSQFCTIFGIAAQTSPVRLQDILKYVHPDDRSLVERSFEDIEDFGTSIQIHHRIIRPDQSVRVVLHQIDAGFESMLGEFSRVGLVLDISDQVDKEERLQRAWDESKVLLRELHHRVRNNLSMIVAMLSLKALDPGTSSAAEALEEASGRVQTISLIHDQLYENKSLANVEVSNYVQELCSRIVNSQQVHVGFEYDVSINRLSVSEMTPIGLILNEAITNSLKHAFSGVESPLIQVVVRIESGDEVFFSIADNGVGNPVLAGDTQVEEGLGLTLIRKLAHQIRGKLTIRSQVDQGTVIMIRFPTNEQGAQY